MDEPEWMQPRGCNSIDEHEWMQSRGCDCVREPEWMSYSNVQEIDSFAISDGPITKSKSKKLIKKIGGLIQSMENKDTLIGRNQACTYDYFFCLSVKDFYLIYVSCKYSSYFFLFPLFLFSSGFNHHLFFLNL